MMVFALCFLAEVAWCGEIARWAPGEIIVQLKSDKAELPRIGKSLNIATLDELGVKNGLMECRRILPKADPRLPNISRMFLLRFPEEADVPGLCWQYALDPMVEHAEPNYLGELCGTPNDIY